MTLNDYPLNAVLHLKVTNRLVVLVNLNLKYQSIDSQSWRLFINFLCPYKRQISMLRFITLRGVRAHENVEHSQRRENVVYRDRRRIVDLLLQLENKQQIMPNNKEAQHSRRYPLYIGSLCNVAFPLARFTCIVTSQVSVEIWMRWSITSSSAFYTGRKHLWKVFSFLIDI